MTNPSAFPHSTVRSGLKLPGSIRSHLAVLAALLAGTGATAQQVIMTVPDEPLVAPVLRQAAPETTPAINDFHAFPTGPSIATGQFLVTPHLFTSFIHASGLPVQPGKRISTDMFTVAPGLMADIGTHWVFDYTATSHNYSAAELRNVVDHEVRLVGANKSPDWGLQLVEDYSVTNSILVETAQQTKQKTWSNAVSLNHRFSNLLRYDATVGLTKTTTGSFFEARDWFTDHWLRTVVTPKVDAGLGVALGYSDIVARPNTHYERYLGEIKWRPTDKINATFQGGVESFHSLSAAVGDKTNPVFQGNVVWQPLPQTRFVVTDSRRVSNSVVGRGSVESDTWGATFSQRFAGHLILDLTYTHDSSDYSDGTGSPIAGRSDRLRAYGSSLSIMLFKTWRLAALFQSSKNNSSLATFQYSSTQYGLELRGRF